MGPLLDKLWGLVAAKDAEFTKLLQVNGLDLDKKKNLKQLGILREVFRDRVYALCFPFYQNAVVVDVGAHYGYFTLFAALNCAESSRIFALEPSPDNFSMLEENCARNGLENVRLINSGIYSRTGTLDFYLSSSVNHSIFDANTNPLSSRNGSTTCSVISLKELIEDNDIEQIDFLKMDCEGAEYPALFEADEATLGRIENISLEFHDLKDERYSGNRMVAFLQDKGFHVVKFCYDPTLMNLNYGKIVASRKL
jgi:FkbM family methyltransferase